LHGDRNGVTTIPTELASEVVDACPEFMAAEAIVLDYLKAGRPDSKGYALARAACHERIQDLGKRLRTATRPTV
jgi:regulator of RNase E activity RraA